MTEHQRGRLPTFDSPPGAHHSGDGQTSFTVWAPQAQRIDLLLLDPAPQTLPLARDPHGYWRATAAAPPGTRYRYRIDGRLERPDPASRCQPEGVHGPSQVIDLRFPWADRAWRGLPLADYVIYEIHVGTFTPEGTFAAIIPQLPRLKDLGVTAIELMPVAHFPGVRNWGYDGTYLYAPHTAYGGAHGLQRLVDACHAQGIAVILDVVYNHFGPEGNYLWDYARPFFTSRYHTPWGDAINYDGPESGPVRHFVIANALAWLRDYHIDALRLDAVHEIYDRSPLHLLAELADAAQAQAAALGRPAYLIAEGPDPRLVRPRAAGGHGLDAHWFDGLHHAVHVLLTGEELGYMAGYGEVAHLARAYRQGAIFGPRDAATGERRPAAPAEGRPEQFVVCVQNHDQVGNRAIGDRLGATLSLEQLKLAAGAVLLSPFTPLIFMGEEYNEPAPFQYFTDHSDPALVRGVREGRKAEFAAFVAAHGAELPDPQDPATFARSRLSPARAAQGHHRLLYGFYRELLRLRRELPALRGFGPAEGEVAFDEAARTLQALRQVGAEAVWVGYNFSASPQALAPPGAGWRLLLDSAAPAWGDQIELSTSDRAPLAPYSLRLYRRA